MNEDKRRSIDPFERNLIFQVMDDVSEALMPIYHMRVACDLSREMDFNSVLNWLYKNRITGLVFIHWYKKKEGCVNALAHVRKFILKDLEARQVYSKGLR